MIEFTPIQHHQKRIIIAILLMAVLAVAIKWSSSLVFATDGVAAGERIITVHDAGEQKGIVTTATTLRSALQQAGIHLDAKDITEPGLDEALVASSYEANIYRARPVTVRDGALSTTIITAYRTGKQIAKQAGLTLNDEDIATLSPAKDIASEGAAEVLTIDRATPVTLVFYGKTIATATRAKTVGDMLKSKNIVPAKDDSLSVPEQTVVTPGLRVELWKNGKQTVTLDEVVAFTTRQVKDANRERGYKAVQTQGVNGSRTVTYEIVMQNGKEVSRSVVNSVTTTQPVEQVEVVGAKGEYTTPSENEKITWDFLTAKGLTREQTAGIMGNLMQEHKFNTTGDGLAQWTGSRQARLQAMFPDSYSTIQSQLDYLWYELSGPYAKVLAAIQSQTTVEGAVVVFQNQYERCSVCAESMRVQYAYNILASH